ncbi:S9 family peptidase [Sphingomonas sp.]|uniref:S9 family peptidase n=1 Tax=Sphingomonas sp. TaxID=28214 RepID=UPI003B00EC43
MTVATVATALLLAATPLAARPLHSFEALALSPDGIRIASVEAAAEPDSGAEPHPALVVRNAADGAVVERIDPCARCGYAAPAFASDGRIAFVMRDKAAGVAKLMISDHGRSRELASVTGLIDRPRWSPDQTTIAFLTTVGARKEAGATQAGARQTGEIGSSDDEQRIAVVLANAGKPYRLVSPADRYVYEYGWTPDGRGFVATTAKGNGDANWWVATLDAIPLRGAGFRTIARPSVQANFPRVSPDGRTVAFVGGLMSDYGSVGGDVWTVPFAGGEPVDATRGFPGSFTSLDWTRDGLLGTALIADRAAVVPIDPQAGARAPVWTAQATPAAGDGRIVFASGQMAMVAQDFEHGPAIFAGPIGRARKITDANDRYPALVSARSLTWRSDGHDVQGWLLAPLGGPRGRKAPMVTIVHGGPAAASVPAFLWQGTTAALARAGYWLFLPNPRGSYGQGEAFTQANKRDFGGGDLRDILAGVSFAARAAPIDENRLGLMGGSYGGFMAMWANTQTTRFKAIVAAAGVSDWISYYGTNGINTWMMPYFGRSLYDDTAAYWNISAIKFIRQAKTPTLITVGERDIEVPPTQSVEYWNGLKAAGVPTTLVIYPDEGHGIRQPDHAADVMRRTVGWFDRYLGATTR